MKVISFGRASSNDVVVNDPMVSSNFHMKLVVTDDNRVKVVDCNSTNGTFVNGRKVPGEVYINRGDIIRIGNTMIPWENYVTAVPVSVPGGNTQLAESESNPLALAGFICSFFVPVVGVVLSAIGLSKANKSVSKKGKGFAIAGLSISIVWIVLWLIIVLVDAYYVADYLYY
jgi:hypothetical protein